MTNEGKARGFINRLVELDIIIGQEKDVEIAVKGLTQLLDYVERTTLKDIEELSKLDMYK